MDENPVNPATIKKILLSMKSELIRVDDVSQESVKPVTLDQSSVGRLSRMDAMQVQSMSVEAKRRRAIQLQRIENALIRIENDEYGYCLKCDEAIPSKRLDFDPTAFLCVHCAGAAERA